MSNITLQQEGRRIYIVGNSFPIKGAISTAGGHWDGGRKQWWIGSGKRDQIEKAIAKASETPTQYEQKQETASDATEVRGKAEYKGKSYYVICESRDGTSAKLTTLDGKLVFWAKRENGLQIIKRYTPREHHGRATWQTLGGIRRFIEEKKAEESGRKNSGFQAQTKQCWECGRAFTFSQAKTNQGDWQDSYCGC